MNLKAILLYEEDLLPDDHNVCKLLDFFGIPFQILTCDELSENGSADEDIGYEYCVLGSARSIARVIGLLDGSHGKLPPFLKASKSIYIHGFDASSHCKRLLHFIADDPQADIIPLDESSVSLTVSNKYPEILGPLSGLRIPDVLNESGFAFQIFPRDGEGIRELISTSNSAPFLEITRNGTSFFLNACKKVVDIKLPLIKGFFDVKDRFLSVVPIAIYLKWAFQNVCWRTNETGACLIVDDPLLRPRYGFFDFREVLGLMDRHGFSTNIAFIPWNWRRTDPAIADLFRNRRDKYSLSIHGCDHIADEFGINAAGILNAKVKLAQQRMELHRERTGCMHDPIMVFPQGIFSEESTGILKHNNFMAAVNSEAAPSSIGEQHNRHNRTEIGDVWDVAIMKYGSFPIFTRRYPSHGIENVAFDIFLGKPCLIVAHHDFFRNNCRDLIGFMEKLNSLNCRLYWRGLGEVISNSFKERQDAYGNIHVRMYGNNLNLMNSTSEVRTYNFLKRERDPYNVESVKVNQVGIKWDHDGIDLRFKLMLPPEKKCVIRINYIDIYGESPQGLSTGYIIKNSFRRYLSEVRDNYLCKNDLIYKCASKLKRLVS